MNIYDSLNAKVNKKEYFLYLTINIIVLVFAIFLFVNAYWTTTYKIIHGAKLFLQFIIIVGFVHTIKALRLYITLLGTNIDRVEYIKTYCKVTPISILFPFKLGEIFRIYSYGYLINNYLKSTVIILLDRFMDTIALLSIIIFIFVFKGGQLSFLVYLLIFFSIFLLFFYNIFINMYIFW